MESSNPKKRTPRPRKARALLVVAASLTLGGLAAVGCGDDGKVITNPLPPPDMAIPITGNPIDMGHVDLKAID